MNTNKNIQKILVLGYYDRQNLGDDTFKFIFKHFFDSFFEDGENNKKISLEIICSDDAKSIDSDVDLLVIGGGEVLNEYFISKIETLINKSNYTNKVIALSCELGSSDILKSGKLDFIDYFIVRNNSDVNLLTERYKKKYVIYQPDIVMTLNKYLIMPSVVEKVDSNCCFFCTAPKKKVVFCLARSIYTENNFYSSVMDDICRFIKKLVDEDAEVWLLPFNTSDSNNESDILINNDIIKGMGGEGKKNIKSLDITGDIETKIKKTINAINSADLVVCSRYHAHIYSVLLKKPFISLTHTKKVMRFLDENKLTDLSVSFGMKKINKPYCINVKLLKEKYDYIFNNYDLVVKKIGSVNCDTNYSEIVKRIIFKSGRREEAPFYVSNLNCDKFMISLYQQIKDKYNINLNGFREEQNEKTKQLVVKYILFLITKDPLSKYFYGLYEKIFKKNFDFDKEIKWIYRDYNTYNNIYNEFVPTVNKLFIDMMKGFKKINLSHIKQNTLDGYHRSGWTYVVNNLGILNDPKSNILFDAYVDKTFHWACQTYNEANVIPYKQKWIGVVHHTPNTEYSDYNTKKLIENPLFIESLDNCVGLITLSNTLKKWFEQNMKNKNIPIISLVHPTEIPSIQFNMNYYVNNTNKKIIQIGSWLRNVYSIYALRLNSYNLRKYHLIGKDMDNCLLPENINLKNYYLERKNVKSKVNKSIKSAKFNSLSSDDGIFNIRGDSSQLTENEFMCRDYTENKYLKFMNIYIDDVLEKMDITDNEKVKMLLNNQMSVNIIKNVSNGSYDDLLSDNIVFVDLVDMSACNTLIECIVRNTPIIINKHPATIELLGENYPLFYNNLDDVQKLVKIENIEKAHEYLKKINKSKFTIEEFLKNLTSSDIFTSILNV